LLMSSHEGGDFRGLNHILARQAGDIHTRATDVSPLDDSRPHPFSGHGGCHPLSAGAAAKNDDVIFICRVHELIFLGDSQHCAVPFKHFPFVHCGFVQQSASASSLTSTVPSSSVSTAH